MRRTLLVSLLVLIFASVIHAEIAQESDSSLKLMEVMLKLTSPKQEFIVGERVPLFLEITNISDKPIRMASSPYLQQYLLTTAYYEEDGITNRIHHPVYSFGHGKIPIGEIMPTETWRYPLNDEEIKVDNEYDFRAFSKIGTYRIRYIFKHKTILEMHRFWDGEAEFSSFNFIPHTVSGLFPTFFLC
ncbi:MAG: hypothetical protein FJ241_11165 [Nitrospira sp.]|nr:hypothetical protein [Nitrospira sp.]